MPKLKLLTLGVVATSILAVTALITNQYKQSTQANPVVSTNRRIGMIDRNASFLIIGDSLIEGGVGTELEKRLLNNNVRHVKRQGKSSTGLLHPERLDWYAELDKIFAERTYDVVIIMFGLNDLADISDSNGKHLLGTPSWQSAYARKVDQMMQKVLRQGRAKRIIWLGAPIAPDNYKYAHINNTNIQMINNLYRAVLPRYPNTIFIDTYYIYTINGKWTPVITDQRGEVQQVRTQDGIHITYAGGRIMTDIVIQIMRANYISLNWTAPHSVS